MNLICRTETSSSWYYIHSQRCFNRSKFVPTSVTMIRSANEVVDLTNNRFGLFKYVFVVSVWCDGCLKTKQCSSNLPCHQVLISPPPPPGKANRLWRLTQNPVQHCNTNLSQYIIHFNQHIAVPWHTKKSCSVLIREARSPQLARLVLSCLWLYLMGRAPETY